MCNIVTVEHVVITVYIFQYYSKELSVDFILSLSFYKFQKNIPQNDLPYLQLLWLLVEGNRL